MGAPEGVARRIEIPYWPRAQFEPFHERRQRWSIIVAHRRCGKTVATINDMLRRAVTGPKNGRYAYVAPFFVQAKDVAWAYLKRFAAPILELSGRANDSELAVTLPNGAAIRLYGADNYDRMRGLGFHGVVLDEFADFPPAAWPEVLRPALSDHRGWATFIGTPKGHNSFFDLWRAAETDPDWYRVELRASQTGIIHDDELAAVRRDMTEDQYAQEYECSFEAAIVGAYYGRDMRRAEDDKRIGRVPWERSHEVWTAWDLGIGDSTSIWFAQQVGKEVRLIDYYEASGVGLDHYVKVLRDKPYSYAEHLLPHDAEVKELGTGRSRVETLETLGLANWRIVPKLSIDDGINAARMMLPKCWFDSEKCKAGIEALKQYRRDYDEKMKAFRPRPLHDWTSHASDAFRYLAVGMGESPKAFSKPIKYQSYTRI